MATRKNGIVNLNVFTNDCLVDIKFFQSRLGNKTKATHPRNPNRIETLVGNIESSGLNTII